MSAERIADSMQAEIIAGTYRPGTELKQTEIAARFQVSRIPVRDALQLLAARGLIEHVPNQRARVISLSADEIREIYDIRILLECDCLDTAIPKMTAEDLEVVSAAFQHSCIDATMPTWADGDWMFHRSLYRPAGKPRQLAMIEHLRRTCRIHIAGYGVLPGHTSVWLGDHKEILDACHAGDNRRAVLVLRRHIREACATLLAALPSPPTVRALSGG